MVFGEPPSLSRPPGCGGAPHLAQGRRGSPTHPRGCLSHSLPKLGSLPSPSAVSPTIVGLPQVVGLCLLCPPRRIWGAGVSPRGGRALSRPHSSRRGGDPVEAPSVPPRAGCGAQLEPGWRCPTARAATPPAPAALGRAGCGQGPLPAPRLLGGAGKWGALSARCRGAEPEGDWRGVCPFKAVPGAARLSTRQGWTQGCPHPALPCTGCCPPGL